MRCQADAPRPLENIGWLKPEEFVFEVGDAAVGGGQFAGAVLQVTLQYRQAVGGVVHRVHLLAERMDFAGPAQLVMLLAVLGELGALQCLAELFAQILGVG